MTVREEPLYNDRPRPAMPALPQAPAQKRPRGSQIGLVKPGTVERAFIVGLYIACGILVVLSVLGTFYGGAGREAPLMAPLAILGDIAARPGGLLLAIVAQIAMTLTQYGARAMARRDRRWWMLYLAALAVSVYYNKQAYLGPVTEMSNVWVAWVAIIGGDVIPEFVAVKQSE